MDKDFVTFEMAKRLKEKGFPQRPDYFNYSSYYAWDGLRKIHSLSNASVWFDPNIDRENIYFAPTISQVLKWFREEKKIFIAINIGYCYESYEKPFPTNPKMEPILKGYYYGVWDLGNLNDKNALSEYFESYELAAIAGIEYVLDNLIMKDRYCEECRFIKDEGGEHGTCKLHNCHVYKSYKVCSDYQAEEMFNSEEFEV